eukprot:SAG31_NODE_27003_length_432_cov_1.627628_1_plen_31_part_10
MPAKEWSDCQFEAQVRVLAKLLKILQVVVPT